MNRIETILEKNSKIVCILAVYEKNLGDVTRIILRNKESILLPQSINSVLKGIAGYYSLHLRLLRKKQQQLLNVKYYTPLPLHYDLLLFPIKTRTPKLKTDSSTSYINFYDVKKIGTHQKAIHLKNDTIIHSLNSITTLKKRYHQAALCSKYYEEINPIAYIQQTLECYHEPATKREVEIIAKELNNIKDLLKGLLLSTES